MINKYALIIDQYSGFFGVIGKILDVRKVIGFNLVEVKTNVKCENLSFTSSVRYWENQLIIDANKDNLIEKRKIYLTFK